MMAALGVLGIVGMIGNTIASGIGAAKNIPNIQKATKQVLSQTQDLQSKIQAIIQQNTEITEELNQDIQNILLQNQKMYAQIQVERDASLTKVKTIQIGGIIFIVVIFFLLVMKRFGISQSINDILLAPFRKKQK